MSLSNKTFIVTGAGGAIAAHINAALLGAGASLALADRPRNVVGLGARTGGGLELGVDLTTLDGAREMVARTVEHFGHLDGLIHTVGGFASERVLEFRPETYTAMLDANLRTLVYAVAAALPEVVKGENGFIGGISAGQAFRGAGPGVALYTASKAAVAAFLKSLDGELKGTSAKVGVVYPMGTVDTAANRRSMPDADGSGWIDPDEVAAAFVHMASRSSRGRVLETAVYPAR